MRSSSLQTPDEFVSLAARLRAQHETPDPEAQAPEAGEDEGADLEIEPYAMEEREMLRDVRLFRARVAEAVESAVRVLLCDVAAEVLARELHLAPPDIRAVVDAALARFSQEEPVRVRVQPGDATRVRCGIPVVEDARLAAGDAVIELRDGDAVSSLGVRLEAVLGNAAP